MLEVEGLSVNYRDMLALWDLSFSVPQGVLTAVIGPNGAGKSTLFKAVLGLQKALSGSVKILGKPYAKIQKQVAYVPQKASINWQFPINCLEVVLMGGYFQSGFLGWPKKGQKKQALDLLEKLGLAHLAYRQISELSGGQQQRIFLARALMQNAQVIFLDEPFTGVDHATEKMLFNQFLELKKEGKSIYVVHHDLNTVSDVFDYAILINQRLIACGEIHQVMTKENLAKAYGPNEALFNQVLKVSEQNYGVQTPVQ